MKLTSRERIMICVIAALVILLVVVACGSTSQPTSALPSNQGAFSPVLIAEKGSISVYLVNGDVPCVVYRDMAFYAGAGGISCDFTKGDILEGLRR